MTVGSSIRAQFPIFSEYSEPRPLAYLDSAASAQKPHVVIERLTRYLGIEHANIHRGAYRLSADSTELYETARSRVRDFVGGAPDSDIVFTRGATESINLVSYSLGSQLRDGDCVLLTLLEHHSNIVPWQLLAQRTKIKIEYADITEAAELNVEDCIRKIRDLKPKLICCTQLSNAFGTILPIEVIVAEARAIGARVLLDCAQSVAHQELSLDTLGVDFAVFSGHKVYGPTGIGVLYARAGILNTLEPFQGGGGMIEQVSTEGSRWAAAPQRFEAGTPPIAEAIGLATALDFISSIGFDVIAAHEVAIFESAWERLAREQGVTLLGPRTAGGEQCSIIPFLLKGMHPHDFATIADSFNVQLRAGHHCAMPAMDRLNLASTVRLSLGVYSDYSDIDQVIEAVQYARKVFG